MENKIYSVLEKYGIGEPKASAITEDLLVLCGVVSMYCDCDKYHSRYEEANNNCTDCDRPLN